MTITAPTLFDAPLPDPVRPGDPDTSHDAAASITDGLSAQRRSVFDAVCDVERHNRHRVGATAYEVQAVLAYTGHAPQQSVIARRLTDLRDLGLVADSGVRRPGSSGRQLICWTAVDR